MTIASRPKTTPTATCWNQQSIYKISVAVAVVVAFYSSFENESKTKLEQMHKRVWARFVWNKRKIIVIEL